jgi:uncharacterized protein YprB with RNaseH-like and TPR domain
MAHNLRARLRRIKEAGRPEAPSVPPVPEKTVPNAAHPSLPDQWDPSGFQTLARSVTAQSGIVFSEYVPALALVIPDLIPYREKWGMPVPGDLLFFDLETSGLSGGAGTVAFLAAFGHFTEGRLSVTQYLLLDYPGEYDFLEALLSEFQTKSAGKPPLVVSYNGKSFDSQILKTRCIMNGIKPPEYYHADLLHPARRLWKRMLPNCSQGEIEASILGLDRTGDVPGSMAPDIWFDFLKTGGTGALMGICDHNVRDIRGLASLFMAMARIAACPLDAEKEYRLDFESLALIWHSALRRDEIMASDFFEEAEETGKELLQRASGRGMPRAAYLYAMELLHNGKKSEGTELLRSLVSSSSPGPPEIRAAALRRLAIEAEWHLHDPEAALVHVETALELELEKYRADLVRRRERLLRKCGKDADNRISFPGDAYQAIPRD